MNQVMTLKRYFAGSYRTRLLLGTLFALLVADGLITNFLVTHRFAIEVNLLLVMWVGKDVFLLIKVVGAFLAALLLWEMHQRHQKLVLGATLCFVVSYTFIVYWGLYVFFAFQV